ncbi:unnamed protein product [Thlaspi arvense]|uniref:F-box associated beta-propeller type 3 domain-containing protein n=1 Tax=Thlaspi arvense TaxID=13288 RepID=A0AAU9S197_THLAR|nr:unnamed protein product [Thlaspi arvense]
MIGNPSTGQFVSLPRIKTRKKDIRSVFGYDPVNDVYKLPDDNTLQQFGNLVNHSGKITIASGRSNGPIDLWVLEDAKKGVWSKAAAVVPSVADICGRDQRFMFRGLLATGEIIFAPLPSPNPFFFLCYDPKAQNARKVVIEGIGDDSAHIQVFFDHVESYMSM